MGDSILLFRSRDVELQSRRPSSQNIHCTSGTDIKLDVWLRLFEKVNREKGPVADLILLSCAEAIIDNKQHDLLSPRDNKEDFRLQAASSVVQSIQPVKPLQLLKHIASPTSTGCPKGSAAAPGANVPMQSLLQNSPSLPTLGVTHSAGTPLRFEES